MELKWFAGLRDNGGHIERALDIEPSESELDDESDDEYLAIPEPSTWLASHSLDSERSNGKFEHGKRILQTNQAKYCEACFGGG
ncbi:hypothetical protein B0H13DRAFT_2326659 [Mycena leptocephala]|nr:hypothetical protein B0H13DRAFT_2326659 [Mycena leptocephala]